MECESVRARLLELLANAYILTEDDLDYVHDCSRTLAAYAERTGQTKVAGFFELNRKRWATSRSGIRAQTIHGRHRGDDHQPHGHHGPW